MGSDNLFHKKKFRKLKELARHAEKKSPLETIQIVCEDSKSACDYFRAIKKSFRLNTVDIIPAKGSAPISVVEHGIEIGKTVFDVDRVVCVFDRDQHESYQRAIDKLNKYKPELSDKSKPIYQVITSIPCFEIWLLLHFRYTTKPYKQTGKKSAADHLIADLRNYIPYDKNTTSWFDKVINKTKIDQALRNAGQLQKYNTETDNNNPATNVHELIERLMSLKN